MKDFITTQQKRCLEHALKTGAAFPEPRCISRMGGAYHKMVRRLVRKGYLGRSAPYKITLPGRFVFNCQCSLEAKRGKKT